MDWLDTTISTLIPQLVTILSSLIFIYFGWFLSKKVSKEQLEYQKKHDSIEIKERMFNDLANINNFLYDALLEFRRHFRGSSDSFLTNMAKFDISFKILIERIKLHQPLNQEELKEIESILANYKDLDAYISAVTFERVKYIPSEYLERYHRLADGIEKFVFFI